MNIDGSVVLLTALWAFVITDAIHCIVVGNRKRRQERCKLRLCKRLKQHIRHGPEDKL